MWTKAFGKDIVKQWACCCEKHKESGKVQFHLCLKLRRVKRWKSLKQKVIDEAGVVCNFLEFHTNYYDAFCYVKKEDADYITSEGHPVLKNSPQTKKASAKRVSVTSPDDLWVCPTPVKKAKIPRLDTVKVYDIIVENGLKTERELFLLANSQKQEGKTDLLEFILKLSDKRRSELLKTAWRVYHAVNEDTQLKMTALEILMEKGSASDCVCDRQYRHCAAEILDDNSIDKAEFKEAVTKALSEGRKKGNNIMLIGPEIVA